MLWLFAYLLGLIAKKATRSNQKFGLIIIRLVISRMGERKEGLLKMSRLKAGLKSSQMADTVAIGFQFLFRKPGYRCV